MKEVKEKIGQRVKDLERAHSTATSDPSAREDITDIGDMEIESDGESQPDSQPDTAKSLVSNAPGMLVSPPSSYTDPRRRQQQNPADIATRGGVYAQPLMPANSGKTQHALPFPPNGPGVMSHYRAVPPAQPQLHRPPNRAQRPLPPPQCFQARAPPPGMKPQQPPPIRPPFRGPVPRPPRPSVNDSVGSGRGGHTFSGSPVMYRPQTVDSGKQGAEQPPVPNSTDIKRSLDERLKDMMMSRKFGNTMLDSVAESPPPDKPYSPSADDPVVQNDVEIEEDRQSLPALNDESPVEETTPTPNMDNPILKALYKSQTSPERNSHPPPSSLVPDYDQEDNDELSASDLKNILDQVKSSELAEPVDDATALPSTDATSLPITAINEEQKASKKLGPPPPSDIKITPSLTSLLDEIFPKISQSLINRKRKQVEAPNDSGIKIPRPSDPVSSQGHPSPQPAPRPPTSPQPRPQPRAPPPRFMPSPGPRFSPGPRVPGPGLANLPPTKLPGEEFPRPFVSYEAARPFRPAIQPRTQGRFVRPLPPPPMPRIRAPMEPRVRPYGDTRFYRPPPPPGYRPARPRYV